MCSFLEMLSKHELFLLNCVELNVVLLKCLGETQKEIAGKAGFHCFVFTSQVYLRIKNSRAKKAARFGLVLNVKVYLNLSFHRRGCK